jgi:hypothetical protein
VVSPDGAAVKDALIRVPDRHHDLARFTDERGCAEFGGVVGPARGVRAVVEKPGYDSRPLKLPLGRSCYVVRLTPGNGKDESSVESYGNADCPCPEEAGYSPTMAARFRVGNDDGTPLALVSLRRSSEQPQPWAQVTDIYGCLGVTWILSARERTVPLVLEGAGYQPVRVDVPAMDERCYSATLARVGEAGSSSIVPVALDACECAMFSGRTIWPERSPATPK